MITIYEAWEIDEGCEISFTTQARIDEERAAGRIPAAAVLLHRITAITWEEAMTRHYELMGWEPYKPVGEPHDCPNLCGSTYFPNGSGECPKCGRIC